MMVWVFHDYPGGRHCQECGEPITADEVRFGYVRIDRSKELHHKRCLDSQQRPLQVEARAAIRRIDPTQ